MVGIVRGDAGAVAPLLAFAAIRPKRSPQRGEKPFMILASALDAASAIEWKSLGLSPVALDLHYIQIRWYSLAYIAGIILGWWYVTRLLRQSGAPMASRHADDLVFYATLGILLGGRLGYVLFYNLRQYLDNPIDIFKLWEGGMSFHGGMIGVILAMIYLARKNRLNLLRVADYISCATPIGLFLGRLANFVNGELWGDPPTSPGR